MKRRPWMYIFVTLLLILATVFSVRFAPVFKEDCDHAVVCEYCEEIAVVENAVNAALEEHGECVEINCLTCIVIGQQIERLEEKHNTEHTCHVAVCDVCVRMAIEGGLRSVVCLLSVFVLAYASWRVIRFVVEEKTLFIRAFSLLGLKIRLNN